MWSRRARDPTRGRLAFGSSSGGPGERELARPLPGPSPGAGLAGEGSLQILADLVERDGEHPLPSLDQIDDLVLGLAGVDASAVGHEGHARRVIAQVLAKVVDGPPDALQGDARVDQALDDPEQEEVLER